MQRARQALAGALIALAVSAGPTLADDNADIEQAERAIQAENQAVAIYKRMRERAWNAVKKSSLFVEWDRLTVETKRAWDAYMDYRPSREAKKKYEQARSRLMRETMIIERRRDEIDRQLYPRYGQKNDLSDEERGALKDEQGRLWKRRTAILRKSVDLSYDWQKPKMRLEARHRASRAAEDAAYRRMERLAAKLMVKFISDEIKKARAQKRRLLRLKLERILAQRVQA